MSGIASSEVDRMQALSRAQVIAAALFDETKHQLIRPGISESQLSQEIHDLAASQFGIQNHWHKRIVRAGPNTLRPYFENPPDLMIQADDILFLDFGPVFEQWEADFGRTYVIGDDPVKRRLRDDLEPIFLEGKAYFKAHPQATGAELYAHVCGLAEAAGWEFGGNIAGHLVGEFPHEDIPGEQVLQMITTGNDRSLESLDQHGRRRHWILEIHLVDRGRQIGGFYEELLTL